MYWARIGRPNILWSLNKLARAVTKWTRACDRRLARFDFVHSQHVALPATLSCGGMLPNSAEWDCFRISILLGIFSTENRLREVFYVSSEVERFFRSVGCARRKRQFHTVPLHLRSFPELLAYAWTASPKLIFGIWLLKCYTHHHHHP